MNISPNILQDVTRDYPDYLRDESRLVGRADSISFPASEQELRDVLSEMATKSIPVAVQGARTGIAGGAVPAGGHIINLSRLNSITGLRQDTVTKRFHVMVQPGLVLSQLRLALASKNFETIGWSAESLAALAEYRKPGAWFFPPDPTETSASIGGMVAANASGACSFLYGPTRNYIAGARVALADGTILELRRGTERATKRSFQLTTEDGQRISGAVPSYNMPSVKNAAGYFAADNMDMLDLLIGSEGTLGVFSQIELMLIPVPQAIWGVVAFFPSEENALQFVTDLRKTGTNPAAIEFFDERALDLLRTQKLANPAFEKIPEPPAGRNTAIYVEYHCEDDNAVSEAVGRMSETMIRHGGSEDKTWTATEPREMERLKAFRHAVPEAVNLLIDQRRRSNPGITKLGTDMAVPDEEFSGLMAAYHSGLDAAGLDYVMFGHVGNNHVHLNILPRNQDDYDCGKRLYLEWARKVIASGGTVSAEHGVGKLKITLLAEMYGPDGIRQMRDVKKIFDPASILSRGNLF